METPVIQAHAGRLFVYTEDELVEFREVQEIGETDFVWNLRGYAIVRRVPRSEWVTPSPGTPGFQWPTLEDL